MKPRNPTKYRYRHLQWTHHGTVTATFFVSAIDYGLRAPEDKLGAFDNHETLALGCPDNTVLLSLQAPMDLVDMMARMLDNIHLERSPNYIEEALASYERMIAIGPLARMYLLNIPLGTHRLNSAPDRAEIAKRLTEADAAAAAADPEQNFDLCPVPEGLLPFVWNHNLMRGAAMEVAPMDPTNAAVASQTRADFLPGILDEGARTDKTPWRSFDPVLKVMARLDDGHVVTGYQALVTPRSFPRAMSFPGDTEFLSILDGIPGLSVDWAMRLRHLDRDAAIRENEKTLEKLAIQLDERSPKLGFHSREIQTKVATLTDYNDELAVNENAVETAFTTTLALGALDEPTLKRGVDTLRAKFRKLGIRMEAPRGAQSDFWMLLNPGAPPTDTYTHYQHIVASSQWAGFVPFTTARLLDDSGPIIGVNLLSGLFEPLFFNFLGRAETDLSPAIAVAGELGSGKSVFIKSLGLTVCDIDGHFLAVDRSKRGEWADLAPVIPGSVVIDLGNPNWTLDPLQVVADPVRARQVAIDTVLPLLDIPATSDPGKLFVKLLRPDTRARWGLRTLADVRDHCARLGQGEGFDADLHRGLADSMDATEADVLFGRGLDPMPMGASATIVRTHTLSLPSATELSIAHAYANLPWRKRLGHALYELIGVLAREKFICDDGRFGALICDEAYHFTASGVGQQVIEEFVRDGRKHQAGIILASHDPVADYNGVAHNLIPNRFGLRHTDKTLARNTLTWLGVDIDRNEHLVKQMRYGTSPVEGKREKGFVKPNRRGECFIADSRGRIGRGKLFAPARADRGQAVLTTPGRRGEGAAV